MPDRFSQSCALIERQRGRYRRGRASGGQGPGRGGPPFRRPNGGPAPAQASAQPGAQPAAQQGFQSAAVRATPEGQQQQQQQPDLVDVANAATADTSDALTITGSTSGGLTQASDDEARVQLEASLRQVGVEVRSAFRVVENTDQGLLAARAAAIAARTAAALADKSYRAGASTNIEVVDAERRARDADTQVALAEDSARQARLDLLLATGVFP